MLIILNETLADDISLPRDQHKGEDITSISLNLKLPRVGNTLDNSHRTDMLDLPPRDKHNSNPLESLNCDSGASYIDQCNSNNLPNNQIILSIGLESLQNNSITPAEEICLPAHLKLLPPIMEIPDGYKWILVHGG